MIVVMKTAEPCPQCGTTRDAEILDGLCPRCLLNSARGESLPAADVATVFRHETPVDGGPGCEAIPDTLGDYDILEFVARGGMGVVFKAHQRSLNRTVAVKMIVSGQFANSQEVDRFRYEAQAAAHLDHPGIVPIFEVGVDRGRHYFSMPFVEGESLEGRLQKGSFAAKDAATLLLQITEAVAYAHSKGIIHRDLKPGNVLLDEHVRARVTDFGLAKRLGETSQLTATGQTLGTPSFMAPEQARGKSHVGPAADIYALGAILYYLVTGRPPFQGESVMDTFMLVIHRDAPSPRDLVADVDLDLEAICLKCLEKEPDQRYASARELAAELRRYLDGQPVAARRTGGWDQVRRWRQTLGRNKDVRITSRTKWWGVPLVSIAVGWDHATGETFGHAKGVFAYGDVATGVFAAGGTARGLFAFGARAYGGFAFGAFACGLLPMGLVSIGLFAVGGLAVGATAFGAIAIGFASLGMVGVGHFVSAGFAWRW